MKFKLFLLLAMFFATSIQTMAETIQMHPQSKKAIEQAADIDGQIFYKFRSIADLPQERTAMAFQFLREAQQPLAPELILNHVEAMAAAHKKGDDQAFYNHVNLLTFACNNLTYLDAFYRIASATTFTLEENIYEYDEDIATEKIQIYRQVETSFFLSMLSENFPVLQLSFPENISAFSVNQAVLMQTYISMIEGLPDTKHKTESEKSYSVRQTETS